MVPAPVPRTAPATGGGGADGIAHLELGAFLRVHRDRLVPGDVGIVARGRRRVAGLRRHEVADLAGVSVTWYTWLEQGRPVRTTPAVLDALAVALRLDDAERRHLRRLGGAPTGGEATVAPTPGDPLVALLDDLSPHPAYVTGPSFDLLAWNEAYARLYVDPGDLAPRQRNALWMFFNTPEVRDRLDDWEREAREAVARFRAEAGRYPGDARFAEVVADLDATSAEFRTWWASQVVGRFGSRHQVVHHPSVGRLDTVLVQLRPLDQPALVLMVQRAGDRACRERLEHLLAL